MCVTYLLSLALASSVISLHGTCVIMALCVYMSVCDKFVLCLTCCFSTQPSMPQPAFGMSLDLVKLDRFSRLPSLLSYFHSSPRPPPLPCLKLYRSDCRSTPLGRSAAPSLTPPTPSDTHKLTIHHSPWPGTAPETSSTMWRQRLWWEKLHAL